MCNYANLFMHKTCLTVVFRYFRSPPEKPHPTTTTRFPTYGWNVLYSPLCTLTPLNFSIPGIFGVDGVARWPLQIITASNVSSLVTSLPSIFLEFSCICIQVQLAISKSSRGLGTVRHLVSCFGGTKINNMSNLTS